MIINKSGTVEFMLNEDEVIICDRCNRYERKDHECTREEDWDP